MLLTADPQRRARVHVFCAAFLLVACAADTTASPSIGPAGPALVAPGAADGSGGEPLFVCHVEDVTGTGTDFADRTTLVCEPVAGSAWLPSIDVRDSRGAPLDTILTRERSTVGVYVDQYPIALHAYGAFARDAFAGLEAMPQIASTITVTSPDELRTPRGPALPFDVVTLEIESRTPLGRLKVGAAEVSLDGAEVETGATRTPTVTRAPIDRLLRGFETVTLRVPVDPGATSIDGHAGAEGAAASLAPFSVTSGRYALTDTGLVRVGLEPPAPDGSAIARCNASEEHVECRLVPRFGVSVTEATAEVGAIGAVALPVDGTPVVVAPLASESVTVALSVTIASGIEGIRWESMGPIEGEVTVARGEEVALDLPFDLLEARLVYSPELMRAQLAVGSHEVRFRRPWGDRSVTSSSSLSLELVPERSQLYLAVSPGTTSVTGELITFLTSGAVRMPGETVLESAAYYVTADGLAELMPPAPGTTLVACFVEADQLGCDRDAAAPITSAQLTILLESYGRDIRHEIETGREDNILGVGRFYPITLTLVVHLSGASAPLVATARVESGSSLPASAPLAIVAP